MYSPGAVKGVIVIELPCARVFVWLLSYRGGAALHNRRLHGNALWLTDGRNYASRAVVATIERYAHSYVSTQVAWKTRTQGLALLIVLMSRALCPAD